jgi:hypothetical protein
MSDINHDNFNQPQAKTPVYTRDDGARIIKEYERQKDEK